MIYNYRQVSFSATNLNSTFKEIVKSINFEKRTVLPKFIEKPLLCSKETLDTMSSQISFDLLYDRKKQLKKCCAFSKISIFSRLALAGQQSLLEKIETTSQKHLSVMIAVGKKSDDDLKMLVRYLREKDAAGGSFSKFYFKKTIFCVFPH